eukprot:COSAG01_NODE_12717_length_1695_cov_1.251253_3_plen_134_part_00
MQVVSSVRRLEAAGRVSWNGWRGEMPWLSAPSAGHEFGVAGVVDGCAPPAVYTSRQSDTFVMCNVAIEYIRKQAQRRQRRPGKGQRGSSSSSGSSDAEAAPWALHLSLLKPHPPLIAPAPYNQLCEYLHTFIF